MYFFWRQYIQSSNILELLNIFFFLIFYSLANIGHIMWNHICIDYYMTVVRKRDKFGFNMLQTSHCDQI